MALLRIDIFMFLLLLSVTCTFDPVPNLSSEKILLEKQSNNTSDQLNENTRRQPVLPKKKRSSKLPKKRRISNDDRKDDFCVAEFVCIFCAKVPVELNLKLRDPKHWRYLPYGDGEDYRYASSYGLEVESVEKCASQYQECGMNPNEFLDRYILRAICALNKACLKEIAYCLSVQTTTTTTTEEPFMS